jgi:PhnB protein
MTNNMATKSSNKVPAGMHTLTPQLVFNGNCKEAIEFYKKAFDAEIVGQVAPSPDGKSIWHAMMKVGNSMFMLNDAMDGMYEKGPQNTTTVGLWLYVEDCDAWFKKAVEAGAEVKMEMADMFWGDRMGKFHDPFGHSWDIASHVWDYTPEEIQQKQEEFLASQMQK